MDIEMLGGLPPQLAPPLAAAIGEAISQHEASIAQAMMGGCIANLVGHIPDEKWEQMKEASKKPCHTLDCDCHIEHQPLIQALDKLRQEWKRITTPQNPEEKGFSE